MYKNDELLRVISEKFLLRDKILKKLQFLFGQQMSIVLDVDLEEGKTMILTFHNVKSYNFFSEQPEENGYLITHYKLFRDDKLFYLSLDPFTEENKIEEDDNEYVFAEEIFCQIID